MLTSLSDRQTPSRRSTAQVAIVPAAVPIQVRGITFGAFFLKPGARVARQRGMSVFKTISLVCAGALLAFAGTAVAALI
jgi:hypothetical protein